MMNRSHTQPDAQSQSGPNVLLASALTPGSAKAEPTPLSRAREGWFEPDGSNRGESPNTDLHFARVKQCSRFRRVLCRLILVMGFGSVAQADPRIPEFGVGAGYYGWIGIGGHVNVENILAPGVGIRTRGGLNGVEITGLLRLEILYGFSGFVTLGGGYNVPIGQPVVVGSLGLEYRPEFASEFSIWTEYTSYWSPTNITNGTVTAFGLSYWFRQ
jgi:hypothetical protein